MNRFESAITRAVKPKRQTIRPTPKRMPKAGDVESWRVWTGRPYNSKQRELVQVRLTSVQIITITPLGICIGDGKTEEVLTMKQEHHFAVADGFESLLDFTEFFTERYALPFTGILIKAEDL